MEIETKADLAKRILFKVVGYEPKKPKGPKVSKEDEAKKPMR